MGVNMDLLPMKLHYFFMFAAVAPLLPFLPVYANENLGLSYSAIGLVYTILPFVGLVAKTASGTLADFFKIHRRVFLCSVAVCGLGFFSIYFVPRLEKQANPIAANVTLDCNPIKTYLRHQLPKIKCGPADFLDSIKNKGTSTVDRCKVACNVDIIEMQAICQDWGIDPVDCAYSQPFDFDAFTDLLHSDQEDLDIFLPISNLTYMEINVDSLTCTGKIRLNCTADCDNEGLMQFLGAPKYIYHNEYSEIIREWQFWLYLICLVIGWAGLAVLVVMSDTICFQLLGSHGNRYGEQRLFGSIGWGATAILAGFLIDLASDGSGIKNHTPVFFLGLILQIVDFGVAAKLKVEPMVKSVSQFSAIGRLLREPRIILFVLCCVIVGMSTGILWTFQIIYVNDIVYKWDCNFTRLRLLQGLVMGVQCFGGELPFFFVSGWFIKKLGHAHCMSLVIFVFGLRYIMYSFVVNPWLFLPIELTSGFTFGIFYTVMTSYASVVAPVGTDATMQGLVGAAFEGLGVSIGGFIGGALFSTIGGSYAFLYVGVYNIVFASLHFIAQILLNKLRPLPLTQSPTAEGYLPPTDSLQPVYQEESGEDHYTEEYGREDEGLNQE